MQKMLPECGKAIARAELSELVAQLRFLERI